MESTITRYLNEHMIKGTKAQDTSAKYKIPLGTGNIEKMSGCESMNRPPASLNLY